MRFQCGSRSVSEQLQSSFDVVSVQLQVNLKEVPGQFGMVKAVHKSCGFSAVSMRFEQFQGSFRAAASQFERGSHGQGSSEELRFQCGFNAVSVRFQCGSSSFYETCTEGKVQLRFA